MRAALIVGLVAPSIARAQEPRGLRVIDCCTLLVTEVAQLGEVDGNGIIESKAVVARDSGGRFWVTNTLLGSHILVFDSVGRFAFRLGRAGDGPGEYRGISALIPRGDRMLVIDADAQRSTLLSPDGEVLATSRLPYRPLDFAVLTDSISVLNANIRSAALAGTPLHILDEAGAVVRSFGGSGVYSSDVPYASRREVAAATSSSVWSAPTSRYELVLWNVHGERMAILNRNASWFVAHNRGFGNDMEAPPPPLLMDLRVGADGLVRVLTAVPDEDWAESVIMMADHPDGPRKVPGDMNDYCDAIVEYIDPRSGSIVGSVRLDAFMSSFADDDHVTGYAEHNGVPRMHVWRVELVTHS